MENRTLERKRLGIVLATIFVNVVVVALLTLVPWSDWRTGLALNLFDLALLLAFTLRHRDGLMARLLAFGLVAGALELFADAWIVDATHTLDYSVGGGPQLWRSPVWMPLAWLIVCVQFGYVGLRLHEWLGFSGLLLNGVLGAINIPYYEEMACKINWWKYDRCRMISGTPYYIILGEFLIAIALGWLATCLRRCNVATVLWTGALGGVGIFMGYFVAYYCADGFH